MLLDEYYCFFVHEREEHFSTLQDVLHQNCHLFDDQTLILVYLRLVGSHKLMNGLVKSVKEICFLNGGATR